MDRKKIMLKFKQFSLSTESTDSNNSNNNTNDEISQDSKRIQAKLMYEKKKERKQKRDELINANRDYRNLTLEHKDDEEREENEKSNSATAHQGSTTTTSSNKNDLSTTYLVGSSFNSNVTKTSSNNNTTRQTNSKNYPPTDFHFAKPTFITSTRRQLLEIWRQKRREEEAQKDKRPIFKVYHLDPKILDLPKLPQAASFNFKMSVNTTSKSHPESSILHRPVTRSHTRRDLMKPPSIPKSDFFSNFKYDILSQAESSSLKTFSKTIPKSSSTSSLSGKQFMPLPQPPLNIEPIKSTLTTTKTTSKKLSVIPDDNDVETITNRIDNTVYISRQDQFRPSFSSTILHNEPNHQNPIFNCTQNTQNPNIISTDSMPIITETETLTTTHREFQILNSNQNENNQNSNVVVQLNQTIHTEAISVGNNNQNLNIELQVENEVICQNKNSNDTEPTEMISQTAVNIEITEPTPITQVITQAEIQEQQPGEINIEVEFSHVNDELADLKEKLTKIDQVEIDQRNTLYFRDLVKLQTQNLDCFSRKYLAYCDESNCPEDIQGDIRSACGLAKLLIDERFNQFIELIDQSDLTNRKDQHLSNEEIKLVTCSDLQGFWDMVDYQIKDIEKKFQEIEQLKANNYVKVDSSANKNKVVKKASSSNKKTSNATKPAVSSKFAQFRAKIKEQKKQDSIDQDEIRVEIVEERPVVTTPHHNHQTPKIQLNGGEILPTSTNKLLKSALKARQSLLPSSTSATELTPNEQKRYNLRTRQSDLIKFESPCLLCTPNKDKIKQAQSRKSIVRKTPAPVTNKENLNECNEVEEEDEDIFSYQNEKVITWKVNRQDGNSTTFNNTEANTLFDSTNNLTTINPALKIGFGNFRKSISNINSNNTPTRTPIRRTTSGRDSLNPPPTSVLNSPLLKLAYISSHGKRLSISANK